MTKAEKNYRRDYGHKDGEELALNYSRDSLKEELDNMLETVNFDDLTEDEKAYLNGKNQRKNHTLNIRFNDTEWKQICKQAELLKMKKSSYVRECAKASHFLMIDQNDMDNIVGAIRGLSANVNQITFRANKNGKIYDEDIAEMKAKLEEIWQLLNCIRSGVLRESLEYITNGDKTRNHTLVRAFMCSTEPSRAAEQFRAFREQFGSGRSTTQAQHIILSFAPN